MVDIQAEREGLAIKRLLAMTPYNHRGHAILWNTIARESTVRDAMFIHALAKSLVWYLRRKQTWRDYVRRVTSSANRSKGNARRKAKRQH